MLTWALADDLNDKPVTANAVNPGYVLTPLTRNATGALKPLIALTRFVAQPLSTAPTPPSGPPPAANWTAQRASSGTTATEIRCRFRVPTEIQKLRAIVEQQLAHARPLAANTDHEGTASETLRSPNTWTTMSKRTSSQLSSWVAPGWTASMSCAAAGPALVARTSAATAIGIRSRVPPTDESVSTLPIPVNQ
jgi:hypothetical protein